MTSLKEEEPFAFVVKDEFLDSTCSSCLAFQGVVHKCRGCHVLSYCNEQCQKNDWANHKKECRILKKEKMSKEASIPSKYSRLTIRILLKSEKELAKKAFNDRSWESLEERVEEIKGGKGSHYYVGVDYIVAAMKSVKEVSRAEVVKTLNKIVTNDVLIVESVLGILDVACGVYLGLSIHKHSCLPDAQLIFTGTKASLRVFDETAEYSTDLTISYTNHSPYTLDRKSIFKTKYFFDCTCPLCTDDNHILNRMGSSCYVSCCKDAAGIRDENSSGPYRCNKCGSVSPVTVNKVTFVEEKIKLHLQMASMLVPLELDTDIMINKTIELLFSCEKVLSVYNIHFMKLCNNVPRIAKTTSHRLNKYAKDKHLKAVEYYLPGGDTRKIALLLSRVFLKNNLNDADDFDDLQVLNTVERTFGTDHPVTVRFKDPLLWNEHFVMFLLSKYE